ncbi:MAG: GNAT family N-acetyltransferase, partial [Pseudonocardiaceae bacterium]
LVGGLLDRAARAFPAASEENRHGWWMRHTDSSMWWSGAVLAHGARQAAPLDEGIATAEKFYARHRAGARFQICPGCPAGLDSALSHRGYRLECPMSLQVAIAEEIADWFSVPSLQVQVSDRLDPAWFSTWRTMGATATHRGPEWRVLQRVRSPSGYVTVFDSDRPVAVGRAVADSGWTGVLGMATSPHARRRGAAKVVLSAIARWAMTQQASRIYLQVEQDNAPARRLYETARFAEVATYHYRLQTRQ